MIKLSIKSRKGIERILEAARKTGTRSYVEIGLKDQKMATIASYLEFGWVQTVTRKQFGYFAQNYGMAIPPGSHLVNPPRPFLRGTLAAEGHNWSKLFKAVIKARGLEAVQTGLLMVGERAQQDVMQTINNNGTSRYKFPDRSPMTMALYALDSSEVAKRDGTGGQDRRQALVKTGVLHKSIGYWLRDKS